MSLNTELSESRAGLVKTVRTPLGFFSLVALIVELALGGAVLRLEGTLQAVALWGMIGTLALLIVVVALIAIFQPHALAISERNIDLIAHSIQVPDQPAVPAGDSASQEVTESNFPQVIPIEVDPRVADKSLFVPLPSGWHQRALYLGRDGATAWLSVVRAAGYMSGPDRQKLREKILSVIKDREVRTFVSLGPGDAETDREVVINLKSPKGSIVYLPVDISEGLLHRAFTKLFAHASVPVGILGDFEEGFGFIAARLETRARSPKLVGLLGNTLGNLDRFERTFLKQVEEWLRPGDYILLDVAISGQKPSDQADRRMDPACYSEEERRFYGDGISRQTGVPVGKILKEYDEAVIGDRGQSDVPGASAVDLLYRPKNTRIVSLRRYDWNQLLEWLEKHFKFQIEAKAHFFYEGGQVGSGAVLLRRLDL